MNVKLSIFILLLTKLSLLRTGHGERTKDQMYEHFNGKFSCFRRLNATHQTGCSSKRDGSTGIIHFVEERIDLDFILKKGSAGDYIPVMPTTLLTPDVLESLKTSEIVSGLVLYNDTAKPAESYSHENVCPNPRSNLAGTCAHPWNKAGTGILHRDLPFPVYYANSDNGDLDKMRDCFARFNNFSYETQYTRSLCSLELDTFMYATTDTPTCLRRSKARMNMNPVKFCDPLGGDNVWASLFPLRNDTANVIVAARLDMTSLFHGMAPGAVSPVTGLVTLLATADLLKRMVTELGTTTKHDKNVLFMLFNGETYDYIGSQRTVYDMERGEFPTRSDPDSPNPVPAVGIEDIGLYVELSQLTRSDAVHMHSNGEPAVTDFNRTLQSYVKYLPKPLAYSSMIPPSSLQSFLKANESVPGVVFADHGDRYVNRFYNSIYDNATNVGYLYYNMTDGPEADLPPPDSIQRHTADISKALALALYQEVTGGSAYKGTQRPRLELIDELYNCYLLEPDCKVHQAVQRKKLRDALYYSFYVGVNAAPNMLTYAVGLTLGWLTGDVVPSANKTACTADPRNPMYQYFEFSKGLDNLNTTVCYRIVMNFTEAVSPAFLIDDYDWKSARYSSWSESTWKDLTVRMFLRPSAAHERFTIALGSVTLVMSLILVYFVKSRSHILFVVPENCSPTSC